MYTAFPYGVFLWARLPCTRRFLMGEVPLYRISESDIAALAKLIDDAEAENPIADIGYQ